MTFQPGANLKMVFESPQVGFQIDAISQSDSGNECVSQSETTHQFENVFV